MLTVPCDVVIPAAIEGALNAEIASAIDATLIVEGANGPTPPAAEYVLSSRGIPIVPDIVANGGGVVSSYFEWVQNHQRTTWPAGRERTKVLTRLEETWRRFSEVDPATWRSHALRLAIEHVVEALHASGRLTPTVTSDIPNNASSSRR